MKELLLTRNDVSVLKQSIYTYLTVLRGFSHNPLFKADIERLNAILNELEE